MRRLLTTLALVAAAIPVGCAFLLDFDELQAGDEDAGAGGATGGGGTGGAAGTPEGCPGGCDDRDPCTVDLCDTTVDPPTCKNEPGGIVQDGLSYMTDADTIYRATMVAARGTFYVSMFTTDNGSDDVELFSFGAGGDAITQGPRLSSIPVLGALRAVSAAGLAADEGAVFNLHVYAALSPPGGGAATVYNVAFGPDLTPRPLGGKWGATSAAPNYDSSDPRRYPVAFRPGATTPVYGAWVGPNGNIHAHMSGTGETGKPVFNTDIPAPTQVFAPVSDGTNPGVFWVSDRAHLQLIAGENLGPRAAFDECDPAPGYYSSAFSTPSWFPGGFHVGWTKQRQESIATEYAFVACGGPGRECSIVTEGTCNDHERFAPLVRNPVQAVFSRTDDPPGRIWQVLVVPAVDPDVDPPEAAITLHVLRVDFDPGDPGQIVDLVPLTPGGWELSRTQLGPAGEGPDWPALAVSGGSKLAVVWLEPKPGGDALRIERFRMCQ